MFVGLEWGGRVGLIFLDSEWILWALCFVHSWYVTVERRNRRGSRACSYCELVIFFFLPRGFHSFDIFLLKVTWSFEISCSNKGSIINGTKLNLPRPSIVFSPSNNTCFYFLNQVSGKAKWLREPSVWNKTCIWEIYGLAIVKKKKKK